MDDKVVWLASNQWNQVKVYDTKPVRLNGKWSGVPNYNMTIALHHMEMCGFHLPAPTWNDEPVELKITLSYEEAQGA